MSHVNKEDALISIIMPAYNCEKFIGEAITSVINQTYKTWELIVIDDCSNDKTTSIIRKLLDKDDRIRFYKNKKNLGVSATRNKGISLSKGDWIAFLDSDDMWEKTKLEKQMAFSQKSNAEFIFTGSSYIDENGKFYKGILEVPSKVTYQKLRNHNVISCSSVLIKKRLLEDIKMERDDMHEDYAAWLRILRKGVCAYGINEPLLIYRISPNSKSGNKLRSIKMTYKVFRFNNMNPVASAYFLIRHLMGSIKKYNRILKG